MLDEFGTGRAIAIGPHIPMQWRLPKNPMKNAVKISGDILLFIMVVIELVYDIQKSNLFHLKAS